MKFRKHNNIIVEAFLLTSLSKISELKQFLSKHSQLAFVVDEHENHLNITFTVERENGTNTFGYYAVAGDWLVAYSNGLIDHYLPIVFAAKFTNIINATDDGLKFTSGEIGKTFKIGDNIILVDVLPFGKGFAVQSRTLLKTDGNYTMVNSEVEFKDIKSAITYLRGYSTEEAIDFLNDIEKS